MSVEKKIEFHENLIDSIIFDDFYEFFKKSNFSFTAIPSYHYAKRLPFLAYGDDLKFIELQNVRFISRWEGLIDSIFRKFDDVHIYADGIELDKYSGDVDQYPKSIMLDDVKYESDDTALKAFWKAIHHYRE